MRPCLFTLKDSNVWLFNGSSEAQNQITNWSLPFPHDSFLLIRCKDIGKYQLSGPKEQLCRNGKWSNEEEEPTCTALNEEYGYDGNFNSVIFR